MFRLLPALLALGGSVLPASALTVTYTRNSTDATAYTTDAPNTPLQLNITSGNATQGGLISGTDSAGITKIGAGTLVLSQVETYTGTTTVSAGSLYTTDSTIFHDAGVSIGSNATLVVTTSTDQSTTGGFTVTSGLATFAFDRTTKGAATTATFGPLTIAAGATLGVSTTSNVNSGVANLHFTGITVLPSGSGTDFTGVSKTAITFDALNGNNGALKTDTSGNVTILGLASNFVSLAVNGSGTLTFSGTANTYTARTTVNSGAVAVTKLADLGQASSLGAPTSAANGAIWLGFSVAGSLLYVGDTDSTTNRILTLAGNSGVGGTVDSSGAGSVTFTGSVGVLAAGTHTLTLTGTNQGANAILGVIPDATGGGAVSVTKSGIGKWTLSGSNSYSGLTTISAGTLSINSLGNVNGGASALGAPTTAANGKIKIGASGTTGTLQYTGGTDGTFVSTDRVIDLGGTTGGATLDASGLGAIKFTSAFTASGNGAKTLTLTGSNLGDNTIGGAIVNSTGATSVTKSGTGTWILSGTSTYTGGTKVTAGTLVAASNQAVGAITGVVTVSGGVFLINSGVTISNSIILSGGSLARVLSGSLAGTVNSTSSFVGGAPATTAALLDGTLTTGTTVQTSFAATSLAGNDSLRQSSVYSLHGTGSDTIVLQLTLGAGQVNSASTLDWLDPDTNLWVNAVLGNTGDSTPFFVNGAYVAADDFVLGYYGVDTTTGSVWAVINHNSDFAVIPEPATCLLVGLGLGSMLFFGRRRSR